MATPTIYTPKRLVAPAQFTGSNATIYTSPAGDAGTQVNTIILTNDTTSAVTATIYLVETGGTAGDANILCKAMSIPTDGTPLVLEFAGLYMNADDTIEGFASTTNQVTYHITGVELD